MPNKSRTVIIFAGVAILSIVALLGMQTWATMARDELPLFSLAHVAPDGRVFVLLDGNLYVESQTGESLEVIPLSRFGVRHFEGDFAVLSDDTIILKSGRVQGEEPLQRCALKTGECRQLDAAGESIQAGVAFRLAVDEPHQRIRVAYTAHHQLLLLDFEGRVLRRQFRGGCLFPSSMARIAEDEFLVSDTRGARIVRVSGRDGDFGKELGQFSIEGWSKQPEHTRPKGVAITGDGTRWIVVTDGMISNGELYRLGHEASTPTPIPLPKGTDTMFPEALADSVLLPDGGVYRIHRFTLDGTRMTDFGSPELKARLNGFAARASVLELLFKGSYAGLLLVSLPMLVVALWMQRKEAASGERVAAPVAPQAGDGEPFRNPESLSRQLRGEYLFQRRFTVLDARDARRVGLLMWVPYLLLGLLTLMMVGVTNAFRPSWGLSVWPAGLLVVMLIFVALGISQSLKHERLSIDARGLRYASLFRGPLALLGRLSPSWELAWEELEHITLKKAAMGGAGGAWYYELRDWSGRKRRINALSWRLVGEDETGLSLRAAPRFSAAEVQAVIHRTRLHRQLAAHLPALASSE